MIEQKELDTNIYIENNDKKILIGLHARKIPDWIKNKKNVEEIIIESEYIKYIPNFFSELKNLKILTINDCDKLIGFPDKLNSVEILNIEGLNTERTQNEQKITIKDLSEMPNLKELYFKRSRLDKIDKKILRYPKIERLSLSKNGIRTIPEFIADLKHLKYFDISNNPIRNIENVSQLKNLEELNILYTGIDDISMIKNMNKLRKIDISSNNFKKEIPEEFFTTNKKLETLIARGLEVIHSDIDDILKNIYNSNSLKHLDLSYNRLDHLPEPITKIPNLKTLVLSHNFLLDIPKNIGQLSKLEYLELDRNPLKNLSYNIGKMPNVKTLKMNETEFSTLPEDIGKLKNLEVLEINDNYKLKELPNTITNLKNLRVLSLSYTPINRLPENIHNLENLEELDVDSTNIDELPKTIGKLKYLRILDFSGTKINTLPSSFKNLDPNKTEVYASELSDICNGLTGEQIKKGLIVNFEESIYEQYRIGRKEFEYAYKCHQHDHKACEMYDKVCKTKQK